MQAKKRMTSWSQDFRKKEICVLCKVYIPYTADVARAQTGIMIFQTQLMHYGCDEAKDY